MKERIGHIYLIRNLLNGKAYIGQTVTSIANRMRRHRYESRKGSKQAIHAAIRKYGIENFAIIRIISCNVALLDKFEPLYIKVFDTFAPTGHGYNLNLGGVGNHGQKASPESRLKMSLAHMNIKCGPHSEATRNKMRIAATGRVHSAESKLKMSQAKKGKKRVN
jgi:group I intron endonuclease